MLNNLLHLKKNNGDKKIPKTLEFTKGFHENPTNILSFKRHQPTIIRVLKKKQEIKTKFLQKSFLSASVKQKFKKILNEFNNNKYQAEKWTSKTYEKEQNRTYTKNSTQFSANCELPVLFKDETKENVSLILRKKREVDERLFEISARLKEYSRNTLPKNKILGENKIGLKCSDLYHILLRLDQKNDNFPDLFKKLKNQTFHEFVTPQKVKNEENRRGYSTGLKNSKYRNNNLELNKAISLWEVSKKQKKIVNKQLFKDYSLQIQKKRGIKELRKCLIAFLTKLKRLKLSPFEVFFLLLIEYSKKV